MNDLDKLLSLVKDRTIGGDAWSDVLIDDALQLAEKLRESGELYRCLEEASKLDDEAKVRLFQVITEFPVPELFPQLLDILIESKGELAEVLIDGLRFWELDTDQRKQLQLASEKFRGQSRLLDKIIDIVASSE